MSSQKEEDNQDLPLLSVQSDYHVSHYIIQLECEPEKKQFSGCVYAFSKPLCSSQKNKSFNNLKKKLILDLKDIIIESVHLVSATKQEVEQFLSNAVDCKNLTACEKWINKEQEKKLEFTVQDWCVEIPLTGGEACVVHLKFHTAHTGSSVLWLLNDQNNGPLAPLALNTGSLVNNRWLFPYQDNPSSMATWQLMLKVTSDNILSSSFIALTTGDEPTAIDGPEGYKYFYTSMSLPLSTFSFAFGHLKCVKQFNVCRQCRLFTCDSLPDETVQHLLVQYITRCLQIVTDLLGPLPVPKLDIVIVPKSVTCLGFASPGLVLISPTILYGRSPMLERVAHEITHSWFGIVIGPKNWNEEWISEGFATFLEDVIDLKMSEGSFDTERLALKAKNRYQILKSDCVNIDSSLQQLSNNQETSGLAVVNGLNREKIVSQIPYLKGYFFLYQLSQLLGMDSFLIALRRFVQQFHLCLVSTLEIVEFFCSNSSHNTAIRQLANSWLYSEDLPVLAPPTHRNRLIIEIEEHLKYWSRPRGAIPVFTNDCPDQIVALLDKLLELPLPTKKDFHRLVEHYEPQRVNADAYHRLCELVVAGEYFDLVHLVRTFLLNHPAMGAYLYGELMLTQLPSFQSVAIQVYQTLQPHLDPEFKAIVNDLVNP